MPDVLTMQSTKLIRAIRESVGPRKSLTLGATKSERVYSFCGSFQAFRDIGCVTRAKF